MFLTLTLFSLLLTALMKSKRILTTAMRNSLVLGSAVAASWFTGYKAGKENRQLQRAAIGSLTDARSSDTEGRKYLLQDD